MNRLIKEGVKRTSSLHELHQHIQILLDNESKWARHNNYLNSISTNQAPSIIESIFSKVVELRSRDDIQGLQVHLDYDNVARRWYRDDLQDTGLEILQRQSIMISTTFQQQVTEIIVPDLHIIKQIRGVNTYSATNQQLCNKKVRYAKGFGKMKKALNLALDFGFDEELINMITLFVDKKMNINDESGSDQLGLTIINDLLVTKHRGRSPTKRLKSSSENQSHDELAHIHHAMNPQDPNLRIPLSNIDPNNSHATDENRRKYVCNICGGSGHNARTCKQNNDSVE
ncbi:11486_t:CDS:2, partial [Gigaspora rosea]